ncbi:MAG: TetR/AcrR family transcriptional regulator [Desulfomonile tiedjei]|nr:TetR/AcrR family transcriptional regulator [Desulfomonile tiedjei]
MRSVSGHSNDFEQDQKNGLACATKWKILAAAEEIMSQKGFANSSISEIARKANVTDSVIYQYFKGKQDLLFSVPGEKLKRQLALLDEHLAGIPDVQSQLQKLIWLQLRYHDAHRAYARLLLMECRSFQAFYSSPAYEIVREYSRIVASVLGRGVKEGRFRSDIPIRLIRDTILGTLDMETLSSLTVGELEAGESDFSNVVDLVDSMIVPKTPPEGCRVNRLDSILNAAKKVFAEKDFAKATISEIASLAGVADGTIYEYFQSKEDILLSMATNRFESYLEQVSGAFEIKSPDRKLRRLIRYHFSSFLSDTEFLKVFLLRLQMNDRFFASKAFEAFSDYCRLIEDVIEEGKAAGVFRTTVNSRVFRNMFLGAFSHMAMRWFVLRESAYVDRMEEIDQITELLTSAVMASPSCRKE